MTLYFSRLQQTFVEKLVFSWEFRYADLKSFEK